MATKKNERCPLQVECDRKCTFQHRELECDYYKNNAYPGCDIEDQEKIREEQEKQQDEQMWEQIINSMEDEEDFEEQEEPETAEPEELKETEEPAARRLATTANVTYLDGPMGVTEKIKKAMYDVARQFVYIGFLLWEVQEYKYYLEKGYQNVYEYAETELGFKRSSTKNFIAINYEFGRRDERAIVGITQQRTMNLQSEYEKFSYSQLCEMLSMSPEKRKAVKPDMTIKQIREIKKRPEPNQEPELPPNMETIQIALPDETTGQTSGQERKEEPKTASITINNTWIDAPKELIRELVKLAGLRCTPSMCFDITIKKHDNT